MIPKISWPVVVIGNIHNGTREHAGLITRVWEGGDTVDGPVQVSAVVFPDGGGDTQYERTLHLYDNRDLALAAGGVHRVAYWAANS